MGKNQFFHFLKDGEIADIDYPIRGVDVIFPHGKGILNNIEKLIKKEFSKLLYSEVDVPGIIPQRFTDHLKQYDLYKVSNRKRNFFLAGSSEIQSAYLAKKLIKDYRELPLRIFNLGKVRREVDTTSLIKNIEIRMFEFNAFFQTPNDAYLEMAKINKVFKKVLERLQIPYVSVYEKAEKKIPEILYTYFPFSKTFGAALWTSIPEDFYTKVVDFSLVGKNNSMFNVIQLNGAFTGRILATYLATHMDSKGFIVDPTISGYDILVIKNKHYFKNKEIKREIDKLKLRKKIIFMNSHAEVIKKFYSTGIPLLIEPGNHEIKILVRDSGKSLWVKPVKLKTMSTKLLKNFSQHKSKNISLKKISSWKEIPKESYGNVFVIKATEERKLLDHGLKRLGFINSSEVAFVKQRY